MLGVVRCHGGGFGRGLLTHKQYALQVKSTAVAALPAVLPKSCAEMGLTRREPTQMMWCTAQEFLSRGGEYLDLGDKVYVPSQSVRGPAMTLSQRAEAFDEGMHNTFRHTDRFLLPGASHTPQNVLAAMAEFESVYLSMHMVTASRCTCVGFAEHSVCWHRPLFRLLKEGARQVHDHRARVPSYQGPGFAAHHAGPSSWTRRAPGTLGDSPAQARGAGADALAASPGPSPRVRLRNKRTLTDAEARAAPAAVVPDSSARGEGLPGAVLDWFLWLLVPIGQY